MATSDDSSLIRCSICFNSKEGRKPRGLSCYHSFCNDCLKAWHEKRHREGHCDVAEVECPTCRAITALPARDISSLPIDITVQQFADYINTESKMITCQVCKSKARESLCLMCSVFLCKDCGVKHKKSPLFASHTLSRNICELHGAVLQGVCTTCMYGVCLHCVNEDLHKDHLLEEMSSGIGKIKTDVKRRTGALKELIRKGNLDVAEKRRYIEQFQCMNEIKRSLDLIKKEVERLEKEITEHERLCNANIDAMFKEYGVLGERTSLAISGGDQLLKEEEAEVLAKLKSAVIPNEELCCLLRKSLSSIPNFISVSSSKCRLENAEDALKALQKCTPVCGIPDVTAVPVTQAPPVGILKINCGDGCDIEDPWRLCGTPEGDVIVCNYEGGPVYKVYKDGTKTRLHDDGIAACVHGGDVYVISTDGRTVTQMKQDGSAVNHELRPSVSGPEGLAVFDKYAFILSAYCITKQSFFDSDYSETFQIGDNLSHILKISHGGVTKLVITDCYTNQVVICDESGAVLTRFAGSGSQDGLLDAPRGISRMSNGNLLVADQNDHRIVEYMDGTFIRNLLTKRDGLWNPADIVYKYPYLWTVENDDCGSYSLKLFKFETNN